MRHYVLQHPERPGAWQCNWFSTVLPDGAKDIVASCDTLREPAAP
jgi:hypothetical protein